MEEKLGFYKIKPEKAREGDGCIISTEHTIAALNISPASFGHTIIFPKNQSIRDFTSEGFLQEDRNDFLRVSHHVIKERLYEILKDNPDLIKEVYKKRINDEKLMTKIPGSKKKLEEAIKNWDDYYNTKNKCQLKKIGNYFENRGPHSGRMISTYHTQYVPLIGNNIIETNDALAFLLTGKRNKSFLTREDILSQKTGVIVENDNFIAVLEKNPSSFGHIAITRKDYKIKNIVEANEMFVNKFFYFLNDVEREIRIKINEQYEEILNFYKKDCDWEEQRLNIIIEEMTNNRKNNGWIIEKRMKDKGVDEFYNGGGSFFNIIKDNSIYHFVPRYAFNSEKQGTGTALYITLKKFKKDIMGDNI